MPGFVVRVAEHPHTYLASARSGIFRGGHVAAVVASDDPAAPAAPPPLGGADDLDVGCGISVEDALEDLAVWLRILAQRVPPLRSDHRPIAEAIRAAEALSRADLVALLHERLAAAAASLEG